MDRCSVRRTVGAFIVAAAVAAPLLASPAVARAEGRGGGDDGGPAVTVMTRNMDEGTDFGFLVGPNAIKVFTTAAQATYAEVVTSDIPGRAAAIADEIAKARPDLVALQEVSLWQGPSPTTPRATVTLDALQALMGRLSADGAGYQVVVVVPEEQIAASIGPATVSFLDRDVILARTDGSRGHLSLRNVSSGHYSAQLTVSIGSLSVTVTRGWASVDATRHEHTVRFIATHLESFDYGVQLAQAKELVAGPAHTSLPVILAGDLNTGPNINPPPLGPAQLGTYTWLTSHKGGRFVDTWTVTRPGVPGFTDSFYTEDPTTPSKPTERIDLVLVRGELTPLADTRVGTSSPHPSDHAGVVARIGISD